MHIPDGYLSPQTYIPMYGISGVFWSIAFKKLKKELSSRFVPYVAMAGAFSFLIMMFNIPIPGGTTGHAVGAGIIAILLGPWVAVIVVSLVLVIQALVFGDGGITTLGANAFNMAIVIPFVSYFVFKLINKHAKEGTRLYIAGFLSGYIGLVVASIMAGIELGIQPLIARTPNGMSLYFPYPLSVSIPVMAIGHMIFFGIAEGIVSAMVLGYFVKHEPELVYALREVP
jgi:cobalt/nickel transport system permease protein